MRQEDFYEVYTDGSYKEGRGAWAYVILKNKEIWLEHAEKVKKSSSNRMEFQAAIEALRVVPLEAKVQIYSNSRILVDTATLWMNEWKRAGWVKAKGQQVFSLDLVRTLENLVHSRSVAWSWVKAHSGVEYNERCDELCIRARDGGGGFSLP